MCIATVKDLDYIIQWDYQISIDLYHLVTANSSSSVREVYSTGLSGSLYPIDQFASLSGY